MPRKTKIQIWKHSEYNIFYILIGKKYQVIIENNYPPAISTNYTNDTKMLIKYDYKLIKEN